MASSSSIQARGASLRDGGFVVTWQLQGNQGGIYGQRYDAHGAAVDGVFFINTTTQSQDNQQRLAPSVTSLSSGGFVVAWQVGREYDDFFGTADIYSRVYPTSDPSFVSTPPQGVDAAVILAEDSARALLPTDFSFAAG